VHGADTTFILVLLGTVVVVAPLSGQEVTRRTVAWLRSGGWPVIVYCCSRLALVLAAWLDVLITHRSFAAELSLFDGRWYLKVASQWYPAQPMHAKSTLGFLPLYPLVIRGLASLFSCPPLVAALAASFAGGLAAAVLVRRLAAIWWGEPTARRAALLLCLCPGSIVFSMAYSECLTLPLVLGCLLALRSGRWRIAGLLAGLASAVEPAAVILFPVCAVAAWRQISASSWQDPTARRSLMAPLLAPCGLGLFAVYLWIRTGTPLACYEAQHYGWHQGDPFALLSQPIADRILDHPASMLGYLRNPSLWNGVLGSAFLVASLVALVRVRDELTPGAVLWTCGVGAMTLWSMMSLTNARMLLIAFPAVIVWARTLSPRRFAVFLGAESVLFLLTSCLTFAGLMLP